MSAIYIFSLDMWEKSNQNFRFSRIFCKKLVKISCLKFFLAQNQLKTVWNDLYPTGKVSVESDLICCKLFWNRFLDFNFFRNLYFCRPTTSLASHFGLSHFFATGDLENFRFSSWDLENFRFSDYSETGFWHDFRELAPKCTLLVWSDWS